ncbi:MAG: beta strand repeat-containing protein [Alphaproteobacteria bacterium]
MATKSKAAKAAVKKLPKEVSVEAAAEAKLLAENGHHAQGGFSTNVVADDASGGGNGGVSPVVILGGLVAAGGIAAAAAGGGGEKTIVQPVPTPVPAPTPAPVPAPTYAVTADKTSADEGTTIRFTISGTNAAGKVVSYQLTGSAATAADTSSPLTGTVTLDSNGKAYVDVVVSADKLTEGAEKLSLVLSGGEKVAADVTVNDTSLTPPPAAQTFTLTTSVDNVVGTNGNDTINAVLNGANSTLTALDVIDGGAGTDTLNIDEVVADALPGGLTIKNVENAVVRSAGDATVDSTTWAGLTSLKATQATTVDLTAATTTAVEVSGATGATVAVNGGSTVAVTTSTADQAVTIGKNAVSAGAVSVTHTKQGTADITIDGGTTVNVTTTIDATTAAVAGGDVVIGGTTQATGAVTVVQNLNSNGGDAEADDLTAAAIDVKGGSSVSITVNAVSTAKDETSDGDILIGGIKVTGDGKTTTVDITQNKTEIVKDDSANTVTYGTVRVDDVAAAAITTLTLNGYGASDLGVTGTDLNALTTLSLANSGGAVGLATSATALDLTVNKVTHAVDISSASAGVATLNVTATGANSSFALTAAHVKDLNVSGDKTLTLTGTTTALENVVVTGSAGLDISGVSANAAKSITTTGTTGTVTAKIDAGVATYTGGAGVDNVTLSSTTVSKAVNTGAGDDKVTLASGTTSLTEAIVAGDGTDTLVMVAADAATASAATTFETKIDGFEKLSLSAVTSGDSNSIDLSNMDDISYVVSAGSAVNTAQVTEIALTQEGTGTAGMEAADSFAVTISGTTFTDTGTARESLDAIGTAMAALIDADAAYAATYDAENDKIVVTAAAAGTAFSVDDAGKFTEGTGTGSVDNGDVTGVATTTTPNVANGALTLTKMANGGTLELTGAGTGATVTMTDATGTADSFNIVTKVDAADVSFGTVAVAGVETVNITATDTTPVNTVTGAATISKATLTVSDADVKSVVVTGNSDLDLTAAGASLTTVNASALTGKLAFSSAVNSAVITGGSAADTLTGSGNSQTLNGGAGADTLIVTGDLATLSGGAGNDVFNIGNATTNVNSYATITDLAAGDLIKFSAGAADFVSAKVTLGDTAVFQDLANAAIANSDTGDVAWFQFSGNTYVIENVSNDASEFVNNTDIIVKITGLVDLSTASFSSSADTLLIA